MTGDRSGSCPACAIKVFCNPGDRTRKVGFDRCLRHAELICDLPIGQFFMTVEKEHLAGAFGKSGDRLLRYLKLLARFKLMIRRRRARAGERLGIVHDIACIERSAMAPGFQVAGREIADRREQEALQIMFGLVRISPADGQEGILHDVFSLGQASDAGTAEAEKRPVLFAENLAECGRASKLGRAGRRA